MIRKNLSNQFSAFLLIIISIIAIYIRINGANYYHYSEDEMMIYGIADARSLWQLIKFDFFEPHPPLFYILLHYWLMISQEIWFARSLLLIFATLLIPLYYKIGKKLGGNFNGLCAAILITFSNVCIVQSYVIRNYAMFLFLLSSAFYFYLLWRDELKNKQLICYFIFSALACATDFSAIFAIFIMAGYETINLLLKKKEFIQIIKWIITNLIIAVILMIFYHFCKNSVSANNITLSDDYETNKRFILGTYFYIPVVIGGILPNYLIGFIVFILLGTILITKKSNSVIFLFLLGFSALFLGIILHYTKIYPIGGSRHWSWLVPFIISLSSLVISQTFQAVYKNLRKNKMELLEKISLLVFIVVGIFNYNSAERFKEVIEYPISEDNWKKTVNYVNSIDNKSLLIAERDDAILLNQHEPYFNSYDYYDENAFQKKSLANMMPYHNTHVLFSQYYRRFIKKYMLVEMLEEAMEKNIIANYDNIIFMETKLTALQVKTSPIQLLFLCPELDKKIIYLSENKPELTNRNIYDFEVLFMSISKKDLIKQLISPTGKARVCLDRIIEKSND